MQSLIAFILLFVSLLSSAQQSPNREEHGLMNEIVAADTMSEQQTFDRHSDVMPPESGHNHEEDNIAHESDDELMVYETPRDYRTFAIRERERMIADGADPDTVILKTEVINHVPRQEGESTADFAKRCSDTTYDMIRRGVSILNDQCTADVVASGFGTADGRFFDLGPGSGATKGEFREFSRWFAEMADSEETTYEVPKRFLKFEKPAEAKSDL